MSGVQPFDVLLARWVLANLPPEEVPDLAVEALAVGCNASELRVLATLRRPTRIQVENELPALLARLGVKRPSRPMALKTVVDDYAMQVADDVIETSAGATSFGGSLTGSTKISAYSDNWPSSSA
jgi:hypothetical protein